MERIKVGGIMQSEGRALLRIMSLPNHAETASAVIGAIGGNGINIELLVESFDIDNTGNFSLVISQKDLNQALTILENIKREIEAKAITYVPDVAIISVFGPHLREKPKIPGIMFSAMASVGINSLAISTSISSVSCVIEGTLLDAAVEALNEVFEAPFQVRKRPEDY